MMPIRSYMLAVSLLLAGCIVPEAGVRPGTYDFGPLPAVLLGTEQTNLPTLTIADVQAPRHMETTYVFYRLAYSDAQAPKPYADSRWAMPPAQLIAQRLRSRLSQNAFVLNAGEVRADLLLKVELEQFDQVFDAPEASRGVVRLRASLIRDRTVVAQQTFTVDRAAASADAVGGVHALTQATDAVLDALAGWLQTHGK